MSDDDNAASFWSLLENVIQVSDEDIDDNMWDHLPQIRSRIQHSSARAFGVGYEWIFEPNKVDIEWPPAAVQTRYKGKYFWYGADHLFKGETWEEMEPRIEGTQIGVTVEEDNYLERVTRVQESALDNMNAAKRIPLPKELEGIYDIIYYAAEYKYILRHHRTTTGTLSLTSVSSGEENGHNILQGRVEMDPKVCQNLDIVPCGGNFSFVETDRYQRVVIPKHDDSRSSSVHDTPTVAGVVQIQITRAPEGTFEMRYGRVTPNVFKGEFKQLEQQIALGLESDCPMPWGEDNAPRRATTERNVEECLQQNKKRKETCLLWMRRHLEPSLAPEVLYRIQEFVSPPPFLILEEDDWVLGVVWSGGLPSYSANSCLVVRKRQAAK